MKFLASILVLAASVSAFSPTSTTSTLSCKSTTALNVIAPEKEVGVLPPLGFFDPLGLLDKGPYGDRIANFRHYRGVEVKVGALSHCRMIQQLC